MENTSKHSFCPGQYLQLYSIQMELRGFAHTYSSGTDKQTHTASGILTSKSTFSPSGILGAVSLQRDKIKMEEKGRNRKRNNKKTKGKQKGEIRGGKKSEKRQRREKREKRRIFMLENRHVLN